jgi:hypothetical protein
MKISKIVTALVASSVLAFAARTAEASTYQFTLSGDYSATWQLPSSLTPAPFSELDGIFFFVNFVDGVFGGESQPADFTFYNADYHGGIDITSGTTGHDFVSTVGEQLYTGDEVDGINFKLGTFALSDFYANGRTYTLNVSDLGDAAATPAAAAAVPEPASLAMILGGLAMAGAQSMRRRRSKAAAV